MERSAVPGETARKDARLATDGVRRAQVDRTAQMRRRLIDATLECIASQGLLSTSTNDVARHAGVSRGALQHQFGNRAELIATAIWDGWKSSIQRSYDRIQHAVETGRPLREQLRIVWEQNEKMFAANIQFWMAAKVDPELTAAYERVSARDPSPVANLSAVDWVRAKDDPSPLLTRYVVGCFINGLCQAKLFNTRETLEDIFEKFVSIISIALDGMGGVEPNRPHSHSIVPGGLEV